MGQRAFGFGHGRAIRRHQLAGQADGRDDGDLLPQDGAHRQFESSPGARHAQAGPGLDQRGHDRVASELRGDGYRVAGQVEHAPHPRNDGGQRLQARKAHSDLQRIAGAGAHGEGALMAVQADRARVAVLCHVFDAGNGAQPQEGQHGLPIVGRAIAQQQLDLAVPAGGHLGFFRAAQLARGTAEQVQENLVEAADAAKARGEGDFRHGQMGFVDELLGQQHAARLGHRHGRGAQMLAKLAAQLAFPHAQTLGERIHPVVVQRAQFNELQGARHAVGQFVQG
ncbi:hypothetical protein G6F57_017098 [Rhizopus arrhizus]|nr:hypothetical protein G6F57_017098 [Rhizopus arrhizus]